MNATHCPSCGNSWTAHPGIAAICVKLQAANNENKRLRAELLQTRWELEQVRRETGRGAGMDSIREGGA